ncbi:DUF2145 domain-containing protein [Glaciecola petra]|uniref:DUF2145 domain-containing protein n=1 Tax=Glaciecola petra TaxID=3075602 RepID=A0ABU2ZUH4_9ALTE|nr:DUF2145 domain-containing protein [Aestuariibacter sp. P117]MDT0596294.1 DUF2145 domain-containing protein [Aestuariibacter sp. P117]
MNRKSVILCLVTFFSVSFAALNSGSAHAGSQQTPSAMHQPEEIAVFAKSVEKYAASKGARAFIIARVGRPAEDLPKGIQYTHTAIAVYSAITLQSGEIVNGYAIHNLYQDSDDKSRSVLMTDYPVDFFWGAYELKAGIVIPTPALQSKLIAAINEGKNKTLHNPKYSVLASPFNSMYQNCTEHTLDVINAAIYNTTNTAQIKLNTSAHFDAQRVHTSRFKLFLGATFMDDITTRDHKGRVKTATFTSIANYLDKFDLSEQVATLRPSNKPNKPYALDVTGLSSL